MTDFSYQLYSSRNFGPLSATLKMVGDLGYKQVEGYGGLCANLDQIDQLKADLAKNGLNMATGHFGFDMVQGQSARVLEIAKALDMKGVFVPAPPSEDYREGKGDWAAFAAALAEAGKPYRMQVMRLATTTTTGNGKTTTALRRLTCCCPVTVCSLNSTWHGACVPGVIRSR